MPASQTSSGGSTQAGGRDSLEAVGRLAAGVAHEINTPIQFIGDSIQFLREAWADTLSLLHAYRELQNQLVDCDQAAPALQRLREMEEGLELGLLLDEVPLALGRSADGIERVASIVRAMKAVTHPGTQGLAPHDLNQAVEAALIVARNEYKYCAELDLHLGELPLVPCDLNAVHQVMLNLVTNAAHAIRSCGESKPGRIQVATDAAHGHAIIRVRDSGTGISPEHLSHIWEPFFTTKEVGEGTGQGLHVVHQIICDQHHGRIECSSTVDQGTTFTAFLPLHQEPAVTVKPTL